MSETLQGHRTQLNTTKRNEKDGSADSQWTISLVAVSLVYGMKPYKIHRQAWQVRSSPVMLEGSPEVPGIYGENHLWKK